MRIINTCSLLLLSFFLSSSSCDKKITEIKDNGELMNQPSNPITIDLNGSDSSMVKSDLAFSFDFFSKVLLEEQSDKDENFMISPFSLSMALAMTWNGSEGDTKLAMQDVLRIDGRTDDEVNSYFNKLKGAFEKTDPTTKLSIANSIWTNKNVEILPTFVSVNKSYYNAAVEAVDFTDPVTVSKINKWAANNTNGLIESVIDETQPSDLMYLLNALYFKGIWVSEFDKSNTQKMTFTTDSITQTEVDMMHQEAKFNYAFDENLQIVELPYGNGAFSMMVLLPKESKQLLDIAELLQQKDYWSNFKEKMSNKKVDLFLPKFKTKYSKKLNSVLTDMGMGIAFHAEKANFSRMSSRDAFISLVSQDTYIETDEIGTEAAAVTSVGVTVTSMPAREEKIVFKADRPFIYMIQEKSSGAILFMGVVKRF